MTKKKVSLELLNQMLGQISTRSLLAGDNTNICQYIELRIDPDPFCTSCETSTINKKAISNTTMKAKTPVKWVFIETITATSSKSLTKDTTFYNHLLIVDAHSKITKTYGMENITTEEVMDKLDMFQARIGKVDEFGCWDMERIKTGAGTQLTPKEFQ